MKNRESLKKSTLVCQFLNSVQDRVDDLFSNGVVPTGIVIDNIFLAYDELLRLAELVVGIIVNFISDYGFQVDKH